MRLRYKVMKDIKKIFLLVILVAILMYIHVLSYTYLTKLSQQKTSVVLPYVVVHIDFKKMPPKLKYLESLLPELKNNGANGLLMEYEDMFPYNGMLSNLSRKDCYKNSELQEFISRAVKLGFEVIPLIQTFGHMEYALKLQEFRHLREEPMYPDSICPNKVESHALIKEMLKQVIYFHNRIFQMKFIHVGCDEVYHINKCLDCQHANLLNEQIFIKHVDLVTGTVKVFSPSTTVLIWDDMLQKIHYDTWKEADHLGDVNPVCWDYRKKITVSNYNLLQYHRNFNNIWIASAFKGADGRTATFPNIKNRFMNHLCWLNKIMGYKFGGENNVYNFKGIILTGWSSYSHMDSPCELLPVSMQSLQLNLYLIKKYKTEVDVDVSKVDPDELFNMICEFSSCELNRGELYILLDKYIIVTNDFMTRFHDDFRGLFAIEYQAREHHIINMNSILDDIKSLNNITDELSNIENKIINVMKLYYTDEAIKEYVHFKTYRVKKIWNEFMLQISPYVKSMN